MNSFCTYHPPSHSQTTLRSTPFQTPYIASTNIRTNSYVHTTNTQPRTNLFTLPPTYTDITYQTMPASTAS